MELQFQKVNENEWVAEFQATADFNLHIERVSSGSITVAQRGTESGEYDTAWAKGVYEGQRVIDYDFGALVYPKWIKVTSSSEVISCVVNFNEGGGSGTGGGEASTVEYLDVRNVSPEILGLVVQMANTVKVDSEMFGGVGIIPTAFLIAVGGTEIIGEVKYVAIDPNGVMSAGGETVTYLTYIESTAGSAEVYTSIPRITKEEFYTV